MSAPLFPILETSRLHLREITSADAPSLLAIHGDPEVMRWFGADPITDLTGAQTLVDLFAGWRALPNPGVRWGLELKSEPGLIGSLGLFGWNRAWRTCTLGYELARSAQGQGLMHEALKTALAWGFQEMRLHRISAQIHPDNAASLRSAKRLGFVEEGRLRHAGFWGMRHHDLLQFSLLRHEWSAA